MLLDGGGGRGPSGLSGFEIKSITPTAPKARARIEALRLRPDSTAEKASAPAAKKRPRVAPPEMSPERFINWPIGRPPFL